MWTLYSFSRLVKVHSQSLFFLSRTSIHDFKRNSRNSKIFSTDGQKFSDGMRFHWKLLIHKKLNIFMKVFWFQWIWILRTQSEWNILTTFSLFSKSKYFVLFQNGLFQFTYILEAKDKIRTKYSDLLKQTFWLIWKKGIEKNRTWNLQLFDHIIRTRVSSDTGTNKDCKTKHKTYLSRLANGFHSLVGTQLLCHNKEINLYGRRSVWLNMTAGKGQSFLHVSFRFLAWQDPSETPQVTLDLSAWWASISLAAATAMLTYC